MHRSLYISFFLLLLPFFAEAQTGVLCNQFQSGSAPPAGYGAAWNQFSTMRELLLSSHCAGGAGQDVTYRIGSGDPQHYIYKQGYYYQSTWRPVSFEGIFVQGSNDWLAGEARRTHVGTPASNYFWVGYVCQWSGSAWRCGCRDASCATNYWQLQGVSYPGGTTGGGTTAGGTTGATSAIGKAVPIAPNAHPNLYYNRQEIEQLRSMIRSGAPSDLMAAWNVAKGKVAQNVPADVPATYPDGERVLRPVRHNNMLAAISYMIEPSQAKADRLKGAVMSFVHKWPGGKAPGFVEGMYGYHVAWMFDLVMGFHPNTFSSAEVQQFKTWAAKGVMMGQAVALNNSRSDLINKLFTLNQTFTVQGKTVSGYPNWYSRSLGPHLALALVSGNQEAVTYWTDSAWPNNVLAESQITASSPPVGGPYNRFDLMMYTLAIYPDGSNTDDHHRCDDGGKYHHAQGIGVQMAAEFAFRNGMTGIYNLKDSYAKEPHLLLHSLYSVRNFGKKHYRCNHTHEAHDNDYLYLTWNRYDHPEINAFVSRVNPYAELEFPAEFITFYRYPRRVVWPK